MLMSNTPTIRLGEALSKECQRKLLEFLDAFREHRLTLEHGKSIRIMLKERVLEPHAEELRDKWDLDYLSWAICWSVQQNTGLDLCEIGG